MVGPTAIGKTALSIALANYFDTSILSADSRQFYKEMSIGTAAPTPEELKAATHYFIHHKSIHDNYTVGDFENEAITKLEALFEKQSILVLVGGSGLYADAITKGLDTFPEIDPEIRQTLNSRLKTEGLESLQNELRQLDPESFSTIEIQNPHRVIRALEVSKGSGQPYSSFKTNTNKTRPFEVLKVGLTADREVIYRRINQRVDKMVDQGLFDEAKSLYDYKDLNALNTVGYKELFKFFDEEWSKEQAISEIKKNTRRFAKRQLTWFRKDGSIMWFDYDTDYNKICETIAQKI